MNTALVRYVYYVRTNDMKIDTNAKHAVKEEISMNTKLFNDFSKRSALSAG